MRRGNRGSACDANQLSLIDDAYPVPPAPSTAPGSLDMDAELRGILSEAITASGLTRTIIAARMSDLIGQPVTVAQLNDWTGVSHRQHRFPASYLCAFEVATESTALQALICRKRGSLLLVGKEALDAELGRVRRQLDQLKNKERELVKRARGRG
jgi:hypothetical protein